jgi:hypothetical protein
LIRNAEMPIAVLSLLGLFVSEEEEEVTGDSFFTVTADSDFRSSAGIPSSNDAECRKRSATVSTSKNLRSAG